MGGSGSLAILDDSLIEALIFQVQKENHAPRVGTDPWPRSQADRRRHAALEQLVLFQDPVVYREHGVEVPELEALQKAGLIRVVRYTASGYVAEAGDIVLLRDVYARRLDWWFSASNLLPELSKELGISYRTLWKSCFDYRLANVYGDIELVRSRIVGFRRSRGDNMKSAIVSFLNDHPGNDEYFHDTIEGLSGAAIAFLKRLKYQFDEAARLRCPLISAQIDWPRLGRCQAIHPVATAPDAYVLMRHALSQAVGYVPRVRSFEDVRRLREDKRIGRFRESVLALCEGLQAGDLGMATAAQQEVTARLADLRAVTSLRKRSSLCGIVSLPVGTLELLTSVPSLASLLISVVGVLSEAQAWRLERRGRWVLLGQ